MKDLGGTIRRWLDFIQEFSFMVNHQAGKNNVNADPMQVQLLRTQLMCTNCPGYLVMYSQLRNNIHPRRVQVECQ